MSATVLTIAAAKEAKIDVIENGRGTQALHDVVVALRANRRSGSANTKTKAEVAYSGKKPWRQKGTGRARAGYASSPVWSGGGVVFGPKPRDYSKKVPKSVRRLALLKALSSQDHGWRRAGCRGDQGSDPENQRVCLVPEVADGSAKGSGDFHAI